MPSATYLSVNQASAYLLCMSYSPSLLHPYRHTAHHCMQLAHLVRVQLRARHVSVYLYSVLQLRSVLLSHLVDPVTQPRVLASDLLKTMEQFCWVGFWYDEYAFEHIYVLGYTGLLGRRIA